MGVTVAVTRAACAIDTAPYTQDFTTNDLGGLTPKAALFIGTYCTVDGTPAAHSVLSLGATDGTRQWVIAVTDEDNQDTTDADSAQGTSECVRFGVPGDAGVDGTAEFSAFIANGVRINWTDAPAGAYLLTVVLFAGTDLSAYAYYKDLGNTVNLAVDITDPGFTPDQIICGCTFQPKLTAYVGLGVVDWDGEAVTQRCVGNLSYGDQATSSVFAASRSDAAIITMKTSGDIDWWGEVSDLDANGFTVTTRNAGANNQELMYLALNYNSAVSHKVITHTTPTDTGNDSETGVGFTPQFALLLQNFTEAVNTVYDDNRAGTIGLAAVTATAQYAESVQSEDNQGTSDTQSLSDDLAVQLPDDDGSAGLTASFVSFDANGWTFNYTAVEGAAKLFFALAIEAEEAGPTYTLTAAQGSLSLSGQTSGVLAGRKLTAAQGSLSVGGQASVLLASRLLTAAQGSLSLSGQTTGLLVGRLLAAAVGSITLTGIAATLEYSGVADYTLVAQSGAISLSGQAAALLAARILAAEYSAFTLSGQAAGVLRGFLLSAAQGSLSISGQDAGLALARLLAAAVGSLSLTGQAVTFVYSGIVTPDARIFIVPAEDRIYVVVSEGRTVGVKSEDRTYAIEA